MVQENRLTVCEARELLDAMEVRRESDPSSIPRIDLVGGCKRMQQFRKTLNKFAVFLKYCLEKQAGRDGRRPLGVSPEAGKMICEYDWSENEREFTQFIEKAVVLCEGDEITPEHLSGLIPAKS